MSGVQRYGPSVNLLLLLSAILSALTGVGGGVGRLQAAPAVAQCSVDRVAARAVAIAPAMRPVAALPGLVAVARAPLTMAARVALAVPLWASRRRE